MFRFNGVASGARLTFDHPATVPDNVELFIPNKQHTLRARVQRRGPNEIGIAFEIDRSLEPRRASDAELQQRVETLESEIATLKRLVAKLKAKVLPHGRTPVCTENLIFVDGMTESPKLTQ